ncbi:MAG: hypothetical protein C0401_08860 [Anaerolinea sp.]|nr:hypothetical protein [Anaerolinea sp.]
MDKLDLKKQYKALYSSSAKDFSVLSIPPLQYIMVDGHGDPGSAPEYLDSVQTLYSLAYTLKFHIKKTLARDFTVMGLEGLWWMPDMSQFSMERKADWDWTMMILQPDFVTLDLFEEAKRQAVVKGKALLSTRARLETLVEDLCVQIMYFGAYDNECATIARMHAFIHDEGFIPNGKHHEIYMSDPRKVAPEKNKTILRQPVKKA